MDINEQTTTTDTTPTPVDPAALFGDTTAPAAAPKRSRAKVAIIASVAGVLVIGGAATAALSLGGDEAPAKADKPAVTATADAAPVETPAAPAPVETVAVPAVGATANTVAEKEAAIAAGLGFYPLSEGGIVFDPAQPLPDAIKADIAAPVVAVAAQGASADTTVALQSASKDAAKTASKQTGKTVVIVYGFQGSLSADGATQMLFAAREPGESKGLGKASLSGSLDEALAKTQAWIAAQPDAASYEVVVAQ